MNIGRAAAETPQNVVVPRVARQQSYRSTLLVFLVREETILVGIDEHQVRAASTAASSRAWSDFAARK